MSASSRELEPTDAPTPTPFRRRVRRAGADRARALTTTAMGLPAMTATAVGERLDRLVAGVVAHPTGVTTADQLRSSLMRLRTSDKSAASAATFLAGTAIARRTIGLGARRVPMLAAVTGVATGLTIFARGLREVRLIASHLVHRARAAGVEVDPRALRTIALQVYLRPHEAPSHDGTPSMLTTRVATRWARTVATTMLPLVPDAIGVPAIDSWVTASESVDVSLLAGRPHDAARADADQRSDAGR
jgi:hypothetical protein